MNEEAEVTAREYSSPYVTMSFGLDGAILSERGFLDESPDPLGCWREPPIPTDIPRSIPPGKPPGELGDQLSFRRLGRIAVQSVLTDLGRLIGLGRIAVQGVVSDIGRLSGLGRIAVQGVVSDLGLGRIAVQGVVSDIGRLNGLDRIAVQSVLTDLSRLSGLGRIAVRGVVSDLAHLSGLWRLERGRRKCSSLSSILRKCERY